MPFNLDPPVVLALVALGVAVTFFRLHRDKQHAAELRERATREFREFVAESTDERFAFRGSSAVVLRREETGGLRGIFERTADLSVTIYALNEHGEAFLFKWFSKSQNPYVKHMPKSERRAGNSA